MNFFEDSLNIPFEMTKRVDSVPAGILFKFTAGSKVYQLNSYNPQTGALSYTQVRTKKRYTKNVDRYFMISVLYR